MTKEEAEEYTKEMAIDIDKSIKELSKWRKNLNYDNGDYCYGDDTTKRSLDVAIETIRKYQKIEEIVKNTQQLCSYGNAFIDIRKVIDDD